MGISIYYGGKLAEGKTVGEVISYIEAIAKRESLRSQRPEEFSDGGKFRFHIPQQVIDNPNAIHWAYPNRKRILKYAEEARLHTRGKSYEDLCQALDSAEFIQVGVYLWVHEQAEPLKFLFVEGDTELTELRSDLLIGRDRRAEPIKYVHFQRDNLATKTAYENDPNSHRNALDILTEVNKLHFSGKMRIVDPK